MPRMALARPERRFRQQHDGPAWVVGGEHVGVRGGIGGGFVGANHGGVFAVVAREEGGVDFEAGD